MREHELLRVASVVGAETKLVGDRGHGLLNGAEVGPSSPGWPPRCSASHSSSRTKYGWAADEVEVVADRAGEHDSARSPLLRARSRPLFTASRTWPASVQNRLIELGLVRKK